ncbi:MAG: hypothetical protein LBP85_07610 [Prevotellaceae bacterium]|nr:hypothetical protein [Prevotellaceae bacterium]
MKLSSACNTPQSVIKKLSYRFKHIILLYYTGQSEIQLYKNISSIFKRSGNATMPQCFKDYRLTSMSLKELH